MKRTESGGAANKNGILYEMLWSLLRLLKITVAVDLGKDADTEDITSATLILEPTGGGGDVQEIAGGQREVIQLKARPGGRAWSLQEIVKDVIPDMYKALSQAGEVSAFRFQTEGRIGDWGNVYSFFQELCAAPVPEASVADTLDDKQPLWSNPSRRSSNTADDDTARAKSFWGEPCYTRRGMFKRIVLEIQGCRSIPDEDEETIGRKLWTLLGRFMFAPARSAECLERDIESTLRTCAPTWHGRRWSFGLVRVGPCSFVEIVVRAGVG